jgi:hypothetical protein
VLGADPKTIQIISPSFAWRDARRVYYQREPIPQADVNTFVDLGHGYYRDKKYVFWGPLILYGADPNTFVTFGSSCNFGTDGSKVWKGENEIKIKEAKIPPGTPCTDELTDYLSSKKLSRTLDNFLTYTFS